MCSVAPGLLHKTTKISLARSRFRPDSVILRQLDETSRSGTETATTCRHFKLWIHPVVCLRDRVHVGNRCRRIEADFYDRRRLFVLPSEIGRNVEDESVRQYSREDVEQVDKDDGVCGRHRLGLWARELYNEQGGRKVLDARFDGNRHLSLGRSSSD